MGRTRFDDQNCGVARALDVLGDWWTLLIIRDAFFGRRRFADFQKNLGISRNILTQRLNSLVENEIFTRVDVGRHGEHFEYRLTEKGETLLPVLTSLREWGDRWIFGEGNEPLIMRERETGRRLPRLEVRNAEGTPVGRREIRAEPGPGASRSTRRLFERHRDNEAPTRDSGPPAPSLKRRESSRIGHPDHPGPAGMIHAPPDRLVDRHGSEIETQ